MRLKSLSLQNFRGFGRFELKTLGRVNLLVGTNNSGKTTVLEAVRLLMADGDAPAVWSTLSLRGEDLYVAREPSSELHSWQGDIRRLFRGHHLELGDTFRISGTTERGDAALTAEIVESRSDQSRSFETEPRTTDPSEDFLPPLALSLHWSLGSEEQALTFPMSPRGGIPLDRFWGISRRRIAEGGFPLRFITAESLTADTVVSLFEEIVLTPEEDLVTDAMRIIEPSIERIASSGAETLRTGSRSSRGGILVRLKNVKDRVPIGSMGDGIWRMLGLALAVVEAKNGILLVDEIDTGLHYSVLKKMWTFLYKCALRFDVQIFATTHSWDCYQSLAVICRDDVSEESDVTISRIEPDREEAVSYTKHEIVAAADLNIEVR